MHQQRRPITPLFIYLEYSQQWHDCGGGFADLQQNRCCSCCCCCSFCSQTVQLSSLLCQDYPSPPLCPVHTHIRARGSTHTPLQTSMLISCIILFSACYSTLCSASFMQFVSRLSAIAGHCMSPTLHQDEHLRESETPDCVKLHQVHLIELNELLGLFSLPSSRIP